MFNTSFYLAIYWEELYTVSYLILPFLSKISCKTLNKMHQALYLFQFSTEKNSALSV